MPEPMMDPPDTRGTRWLQPQVAATLARGPGTPAPGTVTYAWGTSFATRGTLYVWCAGEAEPTALRLTTGRIAACGAGHRTQQAQALAAMRRMLRQLGLLAEDPQAPVWCDWRRAHREALHG